MADTPQRGWPWLNTFEPVPALSGCRPVIGSTGMVSSPHHLASSIGAEMLGQGGSAVDAAIATSAALMALCPMQCGPGGDAFWIMAGPDSSVSVLDATGPAARSVSVEQLRGRGLSEVPKRGGEAVTVPGAVDGWMKAHARFGRLPMADLLEPAARLAADGVIVSRHCRASFLTCEEELREKGALELFVRGDRVPDLYGRVVQPDLATSLREIARTNGRVLYEGPLAREIVKACARWSGFLDEGDLGDYEASWVQPVSGPFRTLQLFTAPPPSQGFCLLAALQAVELVALRRLDPFGPETSHLLIEAAGAALDIRDRINADGAGGSVERAIDEARAFKHWFDPARHQARARAQHGGRKGDTAHLAVVDRDGFAVSLIQSLFFDFGSCIPVPTGGFTLQNRGAAFSLDPAHAGCLQPGKRPPHTLMPTLALEEGSVRLVMGCMGGDGQMQTQLQLLVDILDGGLDPQQATSRARWFLDRADHVVVSEQGAVDVGALERLGHRVIVKERYEEIVGHAQVIQIRAGGVLVGAADPRSDGSVHTPDAILACRR
jgi:gamma-glutamyltranspeptidase/glutathione hydrolase